MISNCHNSRLFSIIPCGDVWGKIILVLEDSSSVKIKMHRRKKTVKGSCTSIYNQSGFK